MGKRLTEPGPGKSKGGRPKSDPQTIDTIKEAWGKRGSGVAIPVESWIVFLDELAKHGNIGKALNVVNISRVELFKRRRDDAEFRAIFEEAHSIGIDACEDEANRRAINGVPEPVFFQGEKCGTVQKFSDTLLMFLLKGNKPEKFKDRSESNIGLTGRVGIDTGKMTTEEIKAKLAGVKIIKDKVGL